MGPIPPSGVRTLSKTGGIMRKTLTALLAATTLGVAALPTSAEARWGLGLGRVRGRPGDRSNRRGRDRASVLPVLPLWVRLLRLPGLLSGMLPGILPEILRLLLRRSSILRLLSVLAPSVLALLVTERHAQESGCRKFAIHLGADLATKKVRRMHDRSSKRRRYCSVKLFWVLKKLRFYS